MYLRSSLYGQLDSSFIWKEKLVAEKGLYSSYGFPFVFLQEFEEIYFVDVGFGSFK